jgi:predicted nuclease of restriction endonuclease-like RecB superfamily
MVDAKYANGGYFKSMGEVYLAEELRKLKSQRKIKGYKYEPEVFQYQHEVQEYTPDFKVITNNDSILFLEYKGKMTREVRKKMRSIKRCNPNKEIYMIFERAENRIEKNSKTTYKKWAEKQGFKCSNKHIEEEWLC